MTFDIIDSNAAENAKNSNSARCDTIRAFLRLMDSNEPGIVLHFESAKERINAYNTIWQYCKRHDMKCRMQGRKTDLYVWKIGGDING